LDAKSVSISCSRRHEAALLEQRRPQPRHQPAQAVGLLGELLADLVQDVQAVVEVAGLDHQQRGLERERRRRHALHRPVVQVARDAVSLLLDRRVRPAHDPRPVLVAVL
jgi:hypothetical protein